jgi:vancomycin resistance protein YoaR
VTDRPTASTDSDLPLGFAPSPEPEKPARRRRRWWVVGIVVTVLVLGGLYLAAYLYAGTTIPRGTTVLGIDLGGQTRQEAEATLAAELPAIADAPVTLLVQQDGYPIVPSESGLNVDVTATVRAAGPGASDPIRLIEVITGGGGPVDPVVVVDESALAAAIDDVADEADRDPVEGRVRFDAGEVVATLPEEGREVERDTSVDLVAESYLTQSAPIALPYEVTVPAVSEDEVTRAVEEFAEPAMSGPVSLRSALGSSQLDTDLLSRVVSMRADDDGVLQPRIDSEALLELSGDQLDELGRPPVDAAVRIQGGAPVVVPAETGRAPDTSRYAERVLAAVQRTGDARVVRIPLVDQAPEYTTAQARDSGVRQVIAEFTTSYPHADYRNINIGRAAELATNTFLKPGDVFSMNGVVGERTEARGFTTGFIIDNGRFMEGVGGGVSQLATTLFNAGHFAGFEDVEHHPHSFYIDRYPPGREATVSWGFWDLQFGNNTPYGAVVQTFITPSSPGTTGSVTARIWSSPYWEVRSRTGDRFNSTPFERQVVRGPSCVPSSGSNGFDIVVTRTLSRNGAVQEREEIFTRYLPTPEVVCS